MQEKTFHYAGNSKSYSVDEINEIRSNFDAQRARMREIYLVKERELSAKENECTILKQKALLLKKELEEKDSQLVIAEYSRLRDLEDQKSNLETETLTLQQLLQETCDERKWKRILARKQDPGCLLAYLSSH